MPSGKRTTPIRKPVAMRLQKVAWTRLKASSSKMVKSVSHQLHPIVAAHLDAFDKAGNATAEALGQEADKFIEVLRDELFPVRHVSWFRSLLSAFLVALHRFSGIGSPVMTRVASDNLVDAGRDALPAGGREMLYRNLFQPQLGETGCYMDFIARINGVLHAEGSDTDKVVEISSLFGSFLSLTIVSRDFPHLVEQAWNVSPYIDDVSADLLDQIIFYTQELVAPQSLRQGQESEVPKNAIEILLRVWFRRALRFNAEKAVAAEMAKAPRFIAARAFVNEERFWVEETIRAFLEADKRALFLPDLVLALQDIGAATHIRDKHNALETAIRSLRGKTLGTNPVGEIRHQHVLGGTSLADHGAILTLWEGWYKADTMHVALARLSRSLLERADSIETYDRARERVLQKLFADEPPRTLLVDRLERLQLLVDKKPKTDPLLAMLNGILDHFEE